MLNVLLTVDVETWPDNWDLRVSRFYDQFRRYVYGDTNAGQYGLPLQLDMLSHYRLRAVFMIEALYAYQFGLDWLRDTVALIRSHGQEVQLHLHPEWLGHLQTSFLPGRAGHWMRDFSLEEQSLIIAKGRQALCAAGAPMPIAFRAGGYGGNHDTLRALLMNDMPFDSSYNPCIRSDGLAGPGEGEVCQPRKLDGVWEFPISCFRDAPGHRRHAQLGACSYTELSRMLMQAYSAGWRYFVIVLHSFELLNDNKDRPDPVALRRFQRLLAFLAEHRDKFHTLGFGDIDPDSLRTDQVPPLHSSWLYTLQRYGEQIWRRRYH